MKYYELKIAIKLNICVHFKDLGYFIGKIINKSMLFDHELIKIHKQNIYKNYVYNYFSPIEKGYIYKKDKNYIFSIRSVSESLIDKFKICLENTNYTQIQIINIQKIKHKKQLINQMITITPCVLTIQGKHWTSHNDINILKERIVQNTIKKYNNYYHKNIDYHDFIMGILLKNKAPIRLNYKGGIMLCNKIVLWIKDDALSQELANFILGVGLLEKTSCIGAGYCNLNKK